MIEKCKFLQLLCVSPSRLREYNNNQIAGAGVYYYWVGNTLRARGILLNDKSILTGTSLNLMLKFLQHNPIFLSFYKPRLIVLFHTPMDHTYIRGMAQLKYISFKFKMTKK